MIIGKPFGKLVFQMNKAALEESDVNIPGSRTTLSPMISIRLVIQHTSLGGCASLSHLWYP